MWKTACATFALLALANPALAAGCASPTDASALKTAVLQQELMVAALQCHETSAYNRFVMSYRGELQSSDASLKAFFVRRGGEHGETGYDTFKTKAANLSALEQARDSNSFCADAHALFTAALAHRGTLMSFVEAKSSDTGIGNICIESRPVMAADAAKQIRADVKLAKTPVLVAVAARMPATMKVAVGGVPAHSLPAIPWRHEERGALLPDRMQDRVVDREDEMAREDDEDDIAPSYAADVEEAPPPRPRYYQIRNRDYEDRGYYPQRAYGPPPSWRDYPAPRSPRGYYRGGW
jgi:hypothetical protein